MAHLFSQIPAQVLNKAGYKPAKEVKTKSVVFADDSPKKESRSKIVRTLKDLQEDEDDLEEVSVLDSASSTTEDYEEEQRKPVLSDAITQTVEKVLQDRGTQTDESLMTRPLTDNDVHRLNMQTYSPIIPIPRHAIGCGPPLRIGLTLRGKKRKVYYPDHDSENRSDFID